MLHPESQIQEATGCKEVPVTRHPSWSSPFSWGCQPNTCMLSTSHQDKTCTNTSPNGKLSSKSALKSVTDLLINPLNEQSQLVGLLSRARIKPILDVQINWNTDNLLPLWYVFQFCSFSHFFGYRILLEKEKSVWQLMSYFVIGLIFPFSFFFSLYKSFTDGSLLSVTTSTDYVFMYRRPCDRLAKVWWAHTKPIKLVAEEKPPCFPCGPFSKMTQNRKELHWWTLEDELNSWNVLDF